MLFIFRPCFGFRRWRLPPLVGRLGRHLATALLLPRLSLSELLASSLLTPSPSEPLFPPLVQLVAESEIRPAATEEPELARLLMLARGGRLVLAVAFILSSTLADVPLRIDTAVCAVVAVVGFKLLLAA